MMTTQDKEKQDRARAFSHVLGLEHRRIQFTPDVMASDLTGFSVYNREKEEFVRWTYFRLAEQVFRKIKGCKKLIFRYGKRFG